MESNIITDLEKRGIDQNFFLEAAANTRKLAFATTIAKVGIDRSFEELSMLLPVMRDEQKTISAKMEARESGMVGWEFQTNEEIQAFDKIPAAMKYAEFLISTKHSSTPETKAATKKVLTSTDT